MTIAEILKPEAVIPHLRASDKTQALESLAKCAAAMTGLSDRVIVDVLLEREQLGSTGVGSGIAIPHGRLRGIDRIHAFFARLDRPVPFEAMDDQPVDLIFLLLAPPDSGTEHLKALAQISRLLRDNDVCERIRRAKNADELHALLIRPPAICTA